MKRSSFFAPAAGFFLALSSFSVSFFIGGCASTDSSAAASAEPKSPSAPKKVLVVTTTTGFRHSSIETAEKVLTRLAQESGAFTVDISGSGPPPAKPKKPDQAKEGANYETALAKFQDDEKKWEAADRQWNERTRQELAKLAPESLSRYDAVIFANTTGDLPLPDKAGFLNWIRSGKGFIGMHSATDTFRGHKPLDPYVEMIGGEFKTHGAQVEVEIINQDPQHPACRHYPSRFKLKDEIYILNGFERSMVHGLLTLEQHPNDKTPGDYPIAWCKNFGRGKVFYTSLGHREDVWESAEYQKHILGGIKWALGLEKGDATPQVKASGVPAR